MFGNNIGWSIYSNNPTDQVVNAGLTAGQWYTISVVYFRINNYALFYVDGVLVDRRKYTTAIPLEANRAFNLGSWDNSRYFDGNIDEVRVRILLEYRLKF
jgi:hypothetical protein